MAVKRFITGKASKLLFHEKGVIMQLTHMLTDEQKAIQDMLRKFVDKEIMPIREKLEEDHSLV